MNSSCRVHKAVLALLTLYFFTLASSDPVGKNFKTAIDYLGKYGYTPTFTGLGDGLISGDTVVQAIKDFQAFAGLEATGEVNDETLELMNTPRCGVKDVSDTRIEFEEYDEEAQFSPYKLQGSRWTTRDLTYTVKKYTKAEALDKRAVDETVDTAFNMWEEEANLTFTRKDEGDVHIEIRFERYEHGDHDPFDGPGGTLAHAYFPQYGGDVHFDDTEKWTIRSFSGTNLLQTMVHEIGHSLGLSHSNVKRSIMAPFYRPYDPNMKLEQDDLDGIQTLYGKKSTPPLPAPEDEVNDLCLDSLVDVMFRTNDGSSYMFKGSLYWKLTDDSVAPGYPRLISRDWPGLPDDIDAAFLWPNNGKTYFFKGSRYWKFDNQRPVVAGGYPRRIAEGFTGIPNNIDAVFVWGDPARIYFFKGGQYWKFATDENPFVSEFYPQSILQRWGLVGDLEAAFQWQNGKTYFFRNGEYFRFNDLELRIDDGFPRPTSVWWFGCKQQKTGNLIKNQNNEELIDSSNDSSTQANLIAV